MRDTFRQTLLAAGAAGLCAALVLTLLQALWITPLILRAETYEDGPAAVEPHAHDVDAHEHAEAGAQHHHDAAWKPENGAERTLFTLAANIVMGVGYGLLLSGVYLLWRRPTGAAQGLLYGLAGFAVFFVAPGLGLPPELPGTAAAELGARQQWWIGTVAASAAGLALLIPARPWWLRLAGLALLLIPHGIGAPQPAAESSLAPAALQTEFRIATAVGNAVFWLLLGALSALALQKLARTAGPR